MMKTILNTISILFCFAYVGFSVSRDEMNNDIYILTGTSSSQTTEEMHYPLPSGESYADTEPWLEMMVIHVNSILFYFLSELFYK